MSESFIFQQNSVITAWGNSRQFYILYLLRATKRRKKVWALQTLFHTKWQTLNIFFTLPYPTDVKSGAMPCCLSHTVVEPKKISSQIYRVALV